MLHDHDTEVQVSIDHLRVSRGELTVEAKDIIISATGPDAHAAAEAVRVQAAELIDRLGTTE